MSSEVQARLKAPNKAFKSGGAVVLKTTRANLNRAKLNQAKLNRAIRPAKPSPGQKVHGHVLSSSPQAHQVFLRSKRANLFLVEEILQGNLERECYEETCDYEEAREYFEDTQRTDSFWTVYIDGDQCESKPCLHGGNCTDQVGGFSCTCADPHYGQICELGPMTEPGDRGGPASAPQTEPEVLQCPTAGPTVCQQMCTVSGSAFSCSCLQGFKLQTDGRTCRPQVAFPCGRLPDVNTTVSACHHGNCPWQVVLLNHRGEELCGGVVLTHRSVLSSARCLVSTLTPPVRPSDVFVRFGNHRYAFPVRAIRIHDRFQVHRHDYDLALLHLLHPVRFSSALIHLCLPTRDFSENILMHSGRSGVTSRPAHGGNQDPVYVTLEECRQDLNVPHPLSNKMFCMRNQNQQTRTGPPGTQRDDWDQTQTGPRGTERDHQDQTQTGPRGTERDHQDQTQTGPPGTERDHQDPTQTSPRGTERDNQDQTQTLVQRYHDPSKDQTPAQTGPAGAQADPNTDTGPSGGLRSDPQRSEVGGGDCRTLLLGTPVATEEQGVVYLTGILTSTPVGCGDRDGLVYTKVSRHLNWIKPRLEEAQDHMTPQVTDYPEDR
ncbi:vitamin K-dependent protein Z-like [Sphaeramia orbicularis]|uniref:vitamin K-dependent protein Z-like n=1 Tax=Sphaeramia orbicularis TaxID=375764 RepID=UPI00117E45B0|nr:vitamin K-dependent protein Z-like [Sphaeramia orbicularis]